MTAIIVLLVVIALLAGAAIAAVLGHTPDTRDPDWTVGRLLQSRN